MSEKVRVLGLGNEILADDAFGIVAARRIEQLFPEQVEVVCTSESGFHLLDSVIDTARLIVVDTIVTGREAPGTIYSIHENDLPFVPGGSPHRIGLFETLALARGLGMRTPEEVHIIAVEAGDCLTVGGAMTAEVEAALPRVLDIAAALLRSEVCYSQ